MSFPMVLGKRSKEPEVNVRPSKRSSVLSGPQWDHASSPVGQTCKQSDVQMPVSLQIEGDLSSMATNWYVPLICRPYHTFICLSL